MSRGVLIRRQNSRKEFWESRDNAIRFSGFLSAIRQLAKADVSLFGFQRTKSSLIENLVLVVQRRGHTRSLSEHGS